MRTTFIWGAGGVGKSHTSIRVAARAKDQKVLVTMDPSLRLFHLLGADTEKTDQLISVGSSSFRLRATNFKTLFDDLDAKIPANPKVRLIYDQMALGLQDFRNYLNLIQIADEIHNAEGEDIFIDTPPFQEAASLHHAMFHLQRFFDKSLVQWAMRSTQSPLMQSTIKKLFDWLRYFSGKAAAQNLYDFIEWLSLHTERFSKAALALEKLLKSHETKHILVVTAETKLNLIQDFSNFFPKDNQIEVILNRSLSQDSIPPLDHPFIKELSLLKTKEEKLERDIKSILKIEKIEKIPLLFLGDDSPAEILEFINA